jgi:hypothetical protein
MSVSFLKKGDCTFLCRGDELWWALIMRAIKCHKGIRWMPWRSEAMKDVVRCDKSWGAANEL